MATPTENSSCLVIKVSKLLVTAVNGHSHEVKTPQLTESEN
jgi:hypothetical protein